MPRRRRNPPKITFTRIDPFAPTPELCPTSENSYTIFANSRIWLGDRITQIVKTGLRVEMPRGFIGVIQPHMYALTRGMFVGAAHPITADYDGELELIAVSLTGVLSPAFSKLLVDMEAPLAILQIVRAPDVLAVMYFPTEEEARKP